MASRLMTWAMAWRTLGLSIGATVLFITHSIPEAVALSDRVLVSSSRPGRIVADIDVDLPRPRPADVEDDPEFIALCAQVRHALHGGRS